MVNYIKITKKGIDETKDKLRTKLTKELIANLSAIEKIVPYNIDDKKKYHINNCNVTNKVKIKLFNFGTEYENVLNENFVINSLNKLGLSQIVKKKYGSLEYFEVYGITSDDSINEILKLEGIKNLDMFYDYNITPMNIHSFAKPFIPQKLGVTGNEIWCY